MTTQMSPSPVRINKIVICKYNNSVFCKFKDLCKYTHIMTNCTKKQCKSKGCPNRHPKLCRFKEKCKRIMTCMFKHEIKVIDQLYNIKEEMKKKTENLQKKKKI